MRRPGPEALATEPVRSDRETAGAPKVVYLHPAQLIVSDRPLTVRTVLGSCVSVCIWDPVRALGGINHYVLPRSPRGGASGRFGDTAVPHLVRQVLALGGRRAALVAKVFGGACIIDAFRGSTDHLGLRNAEIAFEILRAERIRVVDEDVGGNRGRKLTFHPHDGATQVQRL